MLKVSAFKHRLNLWENFYPDFPFVTGKNSQIKFTALNAHNFPELKLIFIFYRFETLQIFLSEFI